MNNSNFTYREAENTQWLPYPPNQTFVSQVQPMTTTHYSYIPQQVIRSEMPPNYNYTYVPDNNVHLVQGVQGQQRVLG